MARTAPVPNFPAIPGMNPGLFLMGGGGDGGGSGGGKGKGKGKNQKGNGKNGGKDAKGGGKGSGACGAGNTGSCTNCGNTFSAGDPVDVTTGRVFTPEKRDLSLPGFFILDIERAYSTSRRDVDTGTGFGWALNVDWQFEVRRASIRVQNGTGIDLRFPRLKEAGDEASRDSWALMKMADGYILRPGNEFLHHFRLMPDGEHRLIGVSYRNRGHLVFHYDQGRLSRIVDTAGRTVYLQRNYEGRLTALIVPAPDGRSLTFARYEYSPAGDLTRVTDADGHVWEFSYDEDHNLLSQCFPTGLEFFYRYDEHGRCVETWGMHRSGQLPELSPSLPPTLADGRTPAKGLLHAKLEFGDDYSEVVNSVNVLRFEHSESGLDKAVNGVGGVVSRTFDVFGRMTSHTDANGATTSWAHDDLGMVVRETDPDGRTLLCARDGEGRPVEVTDPAGGTVRFERDSWGNELQMIDQRGGVTGYVNDPRGLVVQRTSPSGEVTRFEWDAQGNLVAEILPSGLARRFRHDPWGRCVEKRLSTGEVETYDWYPSGKLARRTDGLGRTTTYTFNGLGALDSCVHPDGGRVSLHYGGVSWLHTVEHQDGSRARAYFNREGWPVEVISENGARHTYEYDSDGRPTCETTFQGAVRRTKFDLRGHAIWTEDSTGRWEIERNGAGQIVKETAPDGSVQTFEYDERGDLIGSDNGEVSLRIHRDATGAILGETITAAGQTHRVSATLDASDRRTSLTTSLGLDLRFGWDPDGRITRIATGSGESVYEASYDPAAKVATRALPGGGSMRDTFDPLGRLQRRQVLDGRSLQAGEPQWVGSYWGTVDRRFDYTASDDIAQVESAADGKVTYEYDIRHRLVAKRRDGKLESSWRSDPGSNPYEAGPGDPARVYGEGDRLVRRGDTEYTYDADGFLIEKSRALGTEVWKFHWGPWRELRAVDCPGGRRVEFTYDTFMRRIAKRVLRDGKLERSALWVWDQWGPVHEVVTDGATGQQRTRTFVYDETSAITPVAQRDEGAAWVYYVKGAAGAPDDLVDGSGNVLAHLPRTPYGRSLPPSGAGAATPFSLEGQYEDEETGLHYNRYRYYDPEIGRFISPDPAGIENGSRNLYGYGPNPISWVDPLGLQMQLQVEASNVPGFPAPQGYQSGTADMPAGDAFFHRRAQARLHAERAMMSDLHALREASEDAGQGNPLAGRNVRVRGTRPPCPNCHRAMRAFVDQNQMGGIDYVYEHRPATTPPTDNAVRYQPGQPPQFGAWDRNNQTFSNTPNAQTQQLANAYQMNPGNNIVPGARRDVNREAQPGGYTYQNGMTAKNTYDTITANYN